jgi:ribosomal protein S18 acetylase RimI-like enzyme
MSGFKFLIDTNVVIGLEDHRPTQKPFAELTRRCSEHGIRLFVHAANFSDVERDRDTDRRMITLAKLGKFERLAPMVERHEAELRTRLAGPIDANDESDLRLLAAIHASAVDFLISEDLDLHRRAVRLGLGNKTLTVNDALEWLQQTFQPKEVVLPFIESKKVYQLDVADPIFESIRSQYRSFDGWFEKCRREHRDCWTVEVHKKLAGLVIRKNESSKEAQTKNQGEKVLKICTFKLAEEYRGQKFGEHLLKQILWFAQRNEYDVVYLTAFPDQRTLIELLSFFGFQITETLASGEYRMERIVAKGDTERFASLQPFEFHRKFYPRFFDGPQIKKYYIPILPAYHAKLFPEISFAPELPLFPRENFGELIAHGSVGNRIPGNTIRKVYLCRAQNKSLRPGDMLLFYMSKNTNYALSQCLTTIGIVERISSGASLQDLILLTAKRSVFSEAELSALQRSRNKPVMIIDFSLAGHFEPSVPIAELQETGVIGAHPPQSISEIPDIVYSRLKSHLQLGYKF